MQTLRPYTTNKQHGFVAVTCLTAMTEHFLEVIPVDQRPLLNSSTLSRMFLFSAIKLGLFAKCQVADLAWTISKPMRRSLWY